MQIREIASLIHKVNAKFAIILCHQNADPDAICSAYAFSKLLKRIKPDLEMIIASPEGISRLSKVILQHMPIKIHEEKPPFDMADLIIMLDTNTIQQLGDWGDSVKSAKSPIIVIDHHASHPETEKIAKIYIFDEEASSTCEIIYNLYRELGVKLSEDEAKALFLGITFDTKHFILAKSRTFKVLADLIEAGVNAQEALSTLSLPMDLSERIARLKACQRMRLMRVENWIIAFSHVGAYQASAARALIELGADIALVAGEKDGEVQMSLRSTREFYEKTGIHLGRDLARPLGEALRGMGGGHSTSAGVNGFGDHETAIKRAMEILKARLNQSLRDLE